ncbi:MAG: S8 family serine peptidase [Bacteroidia bacterium]
MKKLAITLILTYLVAIMISGQDNSNSQNTTRDIKFLVALDDVNELINLKTEPFQIDYEKTFRDSDVESALLKKVYSITCLNCKKMNVNNPTAQQHPLDEQNLMALVQKEIKSLVYIEHDVELEPLWDAPNDYDTTSSLSWAIKKEHLNFIEAWEQILPTDADVKVAVMDWNLDFDHPDMCNNIDKHNDMPALYVGQPTNGEYLPTTNYPCIHNHYYDGDPTCGFNPDAAGAATCYSSYYTHGNMVVSMIAAESNNEIGIAGLAHNKAKISFYQAQGTSIYEALLDAANKGISVFNMSFATGMTINGYSETFQAVINEAYNKGMLIIAAAGNFGLNKGNGQNISALEHVFPASYSNIMSVTMTSNDVTGTYSGKNLINNVNYNNTVDIAAGGLNAARLDYEVYGQILIGGSGGTSAAAPTAASLAALIKSVNPTLNNKQIECIMKLTATDIYNDSNGIISNHVTQANKGLGSGLINAGEAVKIARSFDASTEVPHCLITNNRRAFISAVKSNNSIALEGIAEGGIVTWSHDGLGQLIYPANNPNSLSATYQASPNDYGEVIVTMTVTKNILGKNVSYNSFSYITISEGSSSYSLQRFFCDNKGSAPITLEVKELNMDNAYKYKEYEYSWEISNANAGTLTANGRFATFTANPDFSESYYITAWATPYKFSGNYYGDPSMTVSLDTYAKRKLMTFSPSSKNDVFSEIAEKCSSKIGVNEVEGVNYSWSPQVGLSNSSSAATLAYPEDFTTYTLTCTDKICGNVIKTFSFFVQPQSYDTTLVVVKENQTWDLFKKNTLNVSEGISASVIPKTIRDGIIVKKGATLTIKNDTIKFGADEQFFGHYAQDLVITKGIVVEEGAKLILENVTLTTNEQCDDMFWGGIEVRSVVENGILIQGEIELKNSTVEYANTAILFGKKYYEYWTSEEKKFTGAGKGTIDNSLFQKNKDNIVLEKSGGIFTQNRVVINNNVFISDLSEVGFEPKHFITLIESDGVLISNNNFEDKKINPFSEELSAYDFSVEAIYSYNSRVVISDNNFIRIGHGINAYALNGSKTLSIVNNKFNFAYNAITLQGVPYAEIIDNFISCFNPSEYSSKGEWINGMWVEYPSYGIFSASSTGSLIRDNHLQGLRDNTKDGLKNVSRGIVIQSSNEALTKVYNNTIQGFGVGLETQYDNPNLYFYCNQFVNNNNGLFLNIGTPGVLSHQSSTCEQVMKKPSTSSVHFPNNEFITDESKTTIFSDIYAEALIYAPDGTPTRYYDSPKTPNQPELVAEVVEYKICDSTVLASLFPEPSCDDFEKKLPINYSPENVENANVKTNTTKNNWVDSDILRQYLKDNNIEAYVDYLENMNTDFSKKQLVSVYFELGMKDKAQIKLQTLSAKENKMFIELFDELLSSAH